MIPEVISAAGAARARGQRSGHRVAGLGRRSARAAAVSKGRLSTHTRYLGMIRAKRAGVPQAMFNTGQVCVALKRLYVHASQYEEMVAALGAEAREKVQQLGDGLTPGTVYGPLNNAMQRDRVEAPRRGGPRCARPPTPSLISLRRSWWRTQGRMARAWLREESAYGHLPLHRASFTHQQSSPTCPTQHASCARSNLAPRYRCCRTRRWTRRSSAQTTRSTASARLYGAPTWQRRPASRRACRQGDVRDAAEGKGGGG